MQKDIRKMKEYYLMVEDAIGEIVGYLFKEIESLKNRKRNRDVA